MDSSNLLSWLTPLPDSFLDDLRLYREQEWWFPINLIIPDSLGTILAIIGIQLILIFTFYSKNYIWKEVLVLCAISATVTFFSGNQ